MLEPWKGGRGSRGTHNAAHYTETFGILHKCSLWHWRSLPCFAMTSYSCYGQKSVWFPRVSRMGWQRGIHQSVHVLYYLCCETTSNYCFFLRKCTSWRPKTYHFESVCLWNLVPNTNSSQSVRPHFHQAVQIISPLYYFWTVLLV